MKHIKDPFDLSGLTALLAGLLGVTYHAFGLRYGTDFKTIHFAQQVLASNNRLLHPIDPVAMALTGFTSKLHYLCEYSDGSQATRASGSGRYCIVYYDNLVDGMVYCSEFDHPIPVIDFRMQNYTFGKCYIIEHFKDPTLNETDLAPRYLIGSPVVIDDPNDSGKPRLIKQITQRYDRLIQDVDFIYELDDGSMECEAMLKEYVND